MYVTLFGMARGRRQWAHGLWVLGGGKRGANGLWVLGGGSQWVAAVGDGVVGDVVHLLGEGHHGFEVLALAAVEVHLSLDEGFEAPHIGAPPLGRAQVEDLQHQLVGSWRCSW